MASFDSNSVYRGSYMQLIVNPRPYSIANNNTVVDWQIRVYTGTTYWQGIAQTSNLYIDGGSSLWSIARSDTYAVRTWYTLGSGSKTIAHDAAGKKTITLKAALTITAGGVGLGAVSINTSMALPTIPRASSIGTISGNQIGSEITVNISRASSSFTHQVWYALPGQGWQDLGTGHETSCKFTIPLSQSSYLSSSTSGLVNIAVQTKNGSTSIGGEVRKTHTVYVPSSVIPSFSSLSASEGNASVTNAIGAAYVQSKSRVKLTINGASGIHGSSIRSYSITGHGINTTNSSGTTSTITSSGNITYTATVTDSRGRTDSRTATINVLAYEGPKLSSLSYYRSNSSGIADPLGTSITIKGTVTSSSLKVGGVEKNIVNYQSQTALGSAWTDRTTQSYAKTSHAYSATFAGFGVDNSYSVRSRAGDIFDWGSWSAGIIPTGEVTQQWSRKTTSFGKMIDNPSYNIQAGSGGIHSEGPVYSTGNKVMEMLVGTGTTGTTYAKIGTIRTDTAVSFLVFNAGDHGSQYRQSGIITGGSRSNAHGLVFKQFTENNYGSVRAYVKNMGSGTFDIYIRKAKWQTDMTILAMPSGNSPVTMSLNFGPDPGGLSEIPRTTFLDSISTADYVVENGSNSYSTWTKWQSGKMELHARYSAAPSYTAMFGPYAYYIFLFGNYPVAFVGTPYRQITTVGTGQLWIHADNGGGNATTPGHARMFHISTDRTDRLSFDIHAVGRWK